MRRVLKQDIRCQIGVCERKVLTPSKYSDSHSDSLGDGRRLRDFQRRSLGDIGAELRAELGHVGCEERGLVAGARDGDPAKAGVEQVRVNGCVGVYKDALRSEALGTVTGDGEAVIEMAVVLGVEFFLTVAVETSGDTAVRRNGFDGGKVAIGDAKRLVGCGELDAVAN